MTDKLDELVAKQEKEIEALLKSTDEGKTDQVQSDKLPEENAQKIESPDVDKLKNPHTPASKLQYQEDEIEVTEEYIEDGN